MDGSGQWLNDLKIIILQMVSYDAFSPCKQDDVLEYGMWI